MAPSASNRWVLLFGASLFLVLVGAWVYWFAQNFERSERTVRSGLSEEARRNPYLAAQRYLDRLGFGVETLRGREHLKAPPSYPGALVVSDPGPGLPPEEEARLLDWVGAGGHLVLFPRRVWNEDTGSSGNGLLDRLGARLHRRPYESGNTDDEGGEDPQGRREIITVHTTADGRPYLASFDGTRYLEDAAGTARQSLAGAHGAHVLRWKRGTGWITVLSDDGFIRNDRIGDLDHAWLVSDLLQDHDQVWLLIDSSIPPLTAWLWRHAPQVVVSLGLLVLLWLWRASLTHGPRRRPRHRVRRNIIEHLAAAAAFSWQRDGGRELLDGSRACIETAWKRRHPALARLDQRGRCEWIADHTGLPAEQVAKALYEPAADEPALIHSTALQQQLLDFLRRP